MMMVWPAVGPAVGLVPENVPVACAAVAFVVRLNVVPVTPLVIVIVGAEVEVGKADTVPIALAVVALLVNVRVFAPLISLI
jgi:hypothetical protein